MHDPELTLSVPTVVDTVEFV